MSLIVDLVAQTYIKYLIPVQIIKFYYVAYSCVFLWKWWHNMTYLTNTFIWLATNFALLTPCLRNRECLQVCTYRAWSILLWRTPNMKTSSFSIAAGSFIVAVSEAKRMDVATLNNNGVLHRPMCECTFRAYLTALTDLIYVTNLQLFVCRFCVFGSLCIVPLCTALPSPLLIYLLTLKLTTGGHLYCLYNTKIYPKKSRISGS